MNPKLRKTLEQKFFMHLRLIKEIKAFKFKHVARSLDFKG